MLEHGVPEMSGRAGRMGQDQGLRLARRTRQDSQIRVRNLLLGKSGEGQNNCPQCRRRSAPSQAPGGLLFDNAASPYPAQAHCQAQQDREQYRVGGNLEREVEEFLKGYRGKSRKQRNDSRGDFGRRTAQTAGNQDTRRHHKPQCQRQTDHAEIGGQFQIVVMRPTHRTRGPRRTLVAREQVFECSQSDS